jgi:pyruvate formate lyase activating enzyme
MHVDPIEKKPLAWFLPGSQTFSIGTYGCNFACRFCQNDELSRHGGQLQRALPFVSPEQIVVLAQRHACQSVAFTYNEPTVFFEYMLDIAKLARAAGLQTVLVTNGYINPKPRAELFPWIDAANIDIKAFSESFYDDLCGASLASVLSSCRAFKHDFGGHLEITNLLIPNRNDAPESIIDLLDWIADALGSDTPVHFSAYHPRGGFEEPPTPPATVRHAVDLAHQRGFTRVRAGNI